MVINTDWPLHNWKFWGGRKSLHHIKSIPVLGCTWKCSSLCLQQWNSEHNSFKIECLEHEQSRDCWSSISSIYKSVFLIFYMGLVSSRLSSQGNKCHFSLHINAFYLNYKKTKDLHYIDVPILSWCHYYFSCSASSQSYGFFIILNSFIAIHHIITTINGAGAGTW